MVDAQLAQYKVQMVLKVSKLNKGKETELLDSKEESAKSQNNTCFIKKSSYIISKCRSIEQGQWSKDQKASAECNP